ncbi:MAG: lactate utilization protein [Gammaproteobacteria bacterium]|nr:MAG: lactate utilization protein [Gammaproteobacteria bacterium]
MTDARNAILQKLQSARCETLSQSIAPYRIKLADPLEHFRRGLEKVSASHETLNSIDQISQAIQDYLHQHQAGHELVVTRAIKMAGLLANTTLQLLAAPTLGNEKNVITLAYAGIAETGSLVLLSGGDTPTTSNFLPDNYICVLRTADILNDMESLWARLKTEKASLPRSINIITGPSRTADVEQTIQMGAHGPRQVHVILWDDAGQTR